MSPFTSVAYLVGLASLLAAADYAAIRCTLADWPVAGTLLYLVSFAGVAMASEHLAGMRGMFAAVTLGAVLAAFVSRRLLIRQGHLKAQKPGPIASGR